MEIGNGHQVCKVIFILGTFPFCSLSRATRGGKYSQRLGMEEIIWSNGSLESWNSMCSLDGEKVLWGRGSRNGGGVWGMSCVGKVGTTIGFGSKARRAGWSGIGEGHSQGASYTWSWDGGEDLEISIDGVGNKAFSWKITFLFIRNQCEVWSYKQ